MGFKPNQPELFQLLNEILLSDDAPLGPQAVPRAPRPPCQPPLACGWVAVARRPRPLFMLERGKVDHPAVVVARKPR